MSESEDDPAFARVWVKDEPDEQIAPEINAIGDENGDDDDGGEEETDPMLSDVKIEK